jgi:4,5-dihydroxyphthalate decarboxylase
MATTLSLGCWNYDRVAALLDGRVGVDGFDLRPTVMPPTEIFACAFTEAPFDISELSLSSYLMQTAAGDCDYVAIPAFLSRAFRHGGVYVNANSGVTKPKDLEGRLVGVPEYQMTMAVWARGILQDEYGVDFRKVRWRTGGLNTPGRKERLPLTLPAEMEVDPIGAGETLNGLLASGGLDAVVAPATPAAFAAGNGHIRRLIEDPAAAERAYFKKTGIFPVMHAVGIRRSLLDKHKGLAAGLYRAFVRAKRIAMDDLAATADASANRLTLPWFAAEWEATRSLMGPDFWSYGVDVNRTALEALCRYSHEQYLSARRLRVEELFHGDTLSLPAG